MNLLKKMTSFDYLQHLIGLAACNVASGHTFLSYPSFLNVTESWLLKQNQDHNFR